MKDEVEMDCNRKIIHLIWGTARPRQWIKSSFLFAPALFTLRILEPDIWLTLIAGAFGFSFIASAVYAFNDIINRAEDRIHPLKRTRPVASGELACWKAGLLSIILLLIGVFLLWLSNNQAVLFGLGYVSLMVVYTIYLRKLFLLDVIVIAIGFVLRVEAGACLINEPVSRWLLLCTFTIALFLAMIKRRQELAALSEDGMKKSRQALADYPQLSIVDGWISVLGGMTALCYALYTMDPTTIAKHHTEVLIYTFPFVLYGIFRYRTISLSGRAGEDPAALIFKDFGIKLVVLLWVVTVGVILYIGKIGN